MLNLEFSSAGNLQHRLQQRVEAIVRSAEEGIRIGEVELRGHPADLTDEYLYLLEVLFMDRRFVTRVLVSGHAESAMTNRGLDKATTVGRFVLDQVVATKQIVEEHEPPLHFDYAQLVELIGEE